MPNKKLKLTKRLVDEAAPDAGRYIIWDAEVRGLGVRVETSGRKTYLVSYRVPGAQRKPALGEHGVITLAQAREMARDLLASVRGGEDPAAARRAAREAPTVADACDRFIEEHARLKKPRTLEQYEALINKYVRPALGKRTVSSIQHEDISKIVYGLGKDYPIAANRLRAVLSKLFALTEKWGSRPTGTNPVVHVERNRERKRHRDLNDDELTRLASVLEEAVSPSKPELALHPRAIAAIRLLLFTGCRRNEVLHLRWSEVDLERGFLRLGDSKTGAKLVHLNVAAREVLQVQSRIEGNVHVFPSERRPGKPLADMKRVWETVRRRAGIDGQGAMRLHDLRHHFASTGAAAGLSLPLIGKLLGHANPATTARYAQLADDPAKRAAEEVGRLIAAALKPANKPAAAQANGHEDVAREATV